MRCPKCKFISFDDLSTCAKCSNDLSALAQDLHGTGTEVRLPFFLAAVVQGQDLDDDNFSASQALPVGDDTNMNFDDTLSGADSLSFDDDNVAIELGEIMPVELDQIDLSHQSYDDSSHDVAKSVKADAIDFNDSLDLNMSDDFDETDLNLSDDFDENELNLSDDFDETEILSIDTDHEDIDLDLTGGFEKNVSLDFEDVDLDATGMTLAQTSLDSTMDMAQSSEEELDLDEDLLAALAEDDDAINLGDNSLNGMLDDFSSFDDTKERETLPADESHNNSMVFNDEIEGLLDDELGDIDTEALTEFDGEDFTDSAPSLNLDDIDVSDLLDSSSGTSDSEDHDTEINLSSLIETPEDEEDDDFDLEMLDEDIPKIDLLSDDE